MSALSQKRFEDVQGTLWSDMVILCHELSFTEHMPDPGHLGNYLTGKVIDGAKDHGPQPEAFNPLNWLLEWPAFIKTNWNTNLSRDTPI